MQPVPTNCPKSEQRRRSRDAWKASLGAGAATIDAVVPMYALVGWPALVLAIVLGLMGRAVAMIERIAAARQVCAEAARAVTQARADARVADATANADIAEQELRAEWYRELAKGLHDPSVPPAGPSSLRRAAGSAPPSVASASAHPEDPARRADDPATTSSSR